MKETTHNSVVTFEESAIVLPLIFGAAALFLAYQVIMAYVAVPPELGDIAGASVTGLVFFGAAVFFAERSIFAFDPRVGTLFWRRANIFTRRSGKISFGDITGVELQSMSGGKAVPSYRIMLRARSGDVPMTRGYSGGPKKWQPIAERIQAIMGESTDGTPLDSGIEGLVRDGRIIDAVRQLRDAEGLSLEDAKAEIERIKGGQVLGPDPS